MEFHDFQVVARFNLYCGTQCPTRLGREKGWLVVQPSDHRLDGQLGGRYIQELGPEGWNRC